VPDAPLRRGVLFVAVPVLRGREAVERFGRSGSGSRQMGQFCAKRL
jgi:hypothetical protein